MFQFYPQKTSSDTMAGGSLGVPQILDQGDPSSGRGCARRVGLCIVERVVEATCSEHVGRWKVEEVVFYGKNMEHISMMVNEWAYKLMIVPIDSIYPHSMGIYNRIKGYKL